MSEHAYSDLAPTWVWVATATNAVLAAAVHVVGGVAYEIEVALLVAATAVGVLYLLYRWGKVREKEPSEESEREKEMKAEAGGYGGNGGGL